VLDADGNPIDARRIFVTGNTGFFEGNEKLSITTAGGNELKFTFDNLAVSSVHPRTITLKALFQDSLPHGVRVQMKASDVHAIFNSGPIAGQAATVVGPNESGTIFAIPFEVTGATLSSSFVCRDNPFNPDKGAQEFRFLTTDPAGVRLTIYALDGQKVFTREYTGGEATEAGDSFARLMWDGRNGSGDIVRNGVYIVVLTGRSTNEQATIKQAVIR
jgi:hypothetical protein